MTEVLDKLIPGFRYRVTFSDVWVDGYFVATFERYEDDGAVAVFDTARIANVDWSGGYYADAEGVC